LFNLFLDHIISCLFNMTYPPIINRYNRCFIDLLLKPSELFSCHHSPSTTLYGSLSYRAIEAARRAIIGQFRRNGKIWVRVLADLPITGKPTEIRMGRGKGNPMGCIARVSTGQILFHRSSF
jgi:hypothetical protein